MSAMIGGLSRQMVAAAIRPKGGVNALRFTVSHTAGFTITPAITRVAGCPHVATWDWGDGSATETGDSMSHAYAGAGTYTVTLRLPRADRWLATIDMNSDHVIGDALGALRSCRALTSVTLHSNAGLNSAYTLATLVGWWPGLVQLHLSVTGAAITGAFTDLPPAMWGLSLASSNSLVTGTMAELPAALTELRLYTTASVITGGDGPAPRGLTTVRIESMGLGQPAVDSILYSLYLAAITPRTRAGGTINVAGTNAAPTGTYQAPASCPVTVVTPGKEIAHALANDGCTVGFNKWSTVSVSV